jgi:uncharacterized membrane protein
MRLREARWSEAIRLTSGLALLGTAAMSLCFCANVLLLDERTEFLAANRLPLLHRDWFAASMLMSFAVPWLVAMPWIIKRPFEEASRTLWRWGHRATPFIALGLAAPLLDRSANSNDPLTTLLWALVVGLLAALLLTGSLERAGLPVERPWPVGRSGSPAWLPTAAVLGASVLLFVHFAVYSLMRHYQMESRSYDLAIFDNMMWNLVHGEGFRSSPAFGPEGNHLSRHATFGALLLAPFYALRQQADTLLLIQALMVASTPIPIYLMARRVLGSAWVGCALGLGYALYAPVHGAVFYDFHFLTTAQPLIAWVFYLLFTERTRALAIMTALALTWREDVGAVLAGGGALVFLRGVHRTRSFVFAVVCAVYFVAMKFAVMPLFGEPSSFAWVYQDLWPENRQSFGGVVQTLLTNPTYTFETLLDKKKLLFVLQLFVPLLFLPVRHRFAWVALMPAALFTLLATRYPPVYEISFQYTAYWGPPMFLATAVALQGRFAEQGRTNPLAANVLAILLVTAITSFHFGSVFESQAFRGGFGRVMFEWTERDAEELAAFRRLAALVPPDASIVATETEAPHLGNRRNCFTMRTGYFDAEYMLVKSAEIEADRLGRAYFKLALDTGQYGFVKADGPFTLWKRGHPTDDNEEGERLLGLARARPKQARPR